jgi:hypothetical protein
LELALSVLRPFKESGGIYNDYKNDDFGDGFSDEEYAQMLKDLKSLGDLVKCSTCGGLFPDENIDWVDREGDKTRPYCLGCDEINEQFTDYRDRSYVDEFDADQQITSEERIAAMLFDSECGMSEELAQHLSQQVLFSILAEYRSDLLDAVCCQIVWIHRGHLDDPNPQLRCLSPTNTREQSLEAATNAFIDGEFEMFHDIYLLTSNDKIPVTVDMLDYKILWEKFGDIPIDEDGCIEEPFLDFEKGDDREEIWHWFEAVYGVSVADLMYKKEGE